MFSFTDVGDFEDLTVVDNKVNRLYQEFDIVNGFNNPQGQSIAIERIY